MRDALIDFILASTLRKVKKDMVLLLVEGECGNVRQRNWR